MTSYSRSQFSDVALIQQLKQSVSRDRTNTAVLLADLAEVDARKLYLPAGYPSMYAYCVDELRLCEQAALKRIRAARLAREFPAIFAMVADGRLHLSGVILLKPYLTPERAEELLAAVARRTTSEIERLLAERFPSSEALPMVDALPDSPGSQLSPGTVEEPVSEKLAPGRVRLCGAPSKVAPIATERFALRITMSQSTRQVARAVPPRAQIRTTTSQ